MDEKVNLDLKSLKIIYNRNKPYIVPVSIILGCIILFFQFVIPQFGALFKAREDGRQAALRLGVLKENLNILTNSDQSTLDSQLRILSLSLPLGKDFGGVLNSIYFAAGQSGATLGKFSFSVGDLSQGVSEISSPVMEVSVPINSGVETVNRFIEEISKTVPLSEVRSVKIGNTSSVVNLSFYYKPLSVSNYSQDDKIKPISQKGIVLIKELSSYGNILDSASE